MQRQVEEQSMTMSMYSSYTPEDFNNIEEDIFGECGTQIASGSQCTAMPDRLGISTYNSLDSYESIS